MYITSETKDGIKPEQSLLVKVPVFYKNKKMRLQSVKEFVQGHITS